jgi:hypothetical protein
MTILDKLDEVERRLKHLPGKHDQFSHNPHKGGGNLGERATAMMDDVNNRLGNAVEVSTGEVERGIMSGSFDPQYEDAVKSAVKDIGFEEVESFKYMRSTKTVYSRGSFRGKGFSGPEVDIEVTGDAFGRGQAYINITDNVAQDIYNASVSPRYGTGG